MARAMAQKDNPINAVLCLKKSSDSLATLVQLLPHERVKTLKPQTYEEVTMATTPPSTVRVTLGQNKPSVTALSYGTRTLKSASDLDLTGAQDGYALIYKADTNSFVVGPTSGTAIALDNGTY